MRDVSRECGSPIICIYGTEASNQYQRKTVETLLSSSKAYNPITYSSRGSTHIYQRSLGSAKGVWLHATHLKTDKGNDILKMEKHIEKNLHSCTATQMLKALYPGQDVAQWTLQTLHKDTITVHTNFCCIRKQGLWRIETLHFSFLLFVFSMPQNAVLVKALKALELSVALKLVEWWDPTEEGWVGVEGCCRLRWGCECKWARVGISRGRVQRGNEPGHSTQLTQGPLQQWRSLTQCMAVPSSRRRLLQTALTRGGGGGKMRGKGHL